MVTGTLRVGIWPLSCNRVRHTAILYLFRTKTKGIQFGLAEARQLYDFEARGKGRQPLRLKFPRGTMTLCIDPDRLMLRTTPSSDPLFWINTDIQSYRKDHPEDKKGSAFSRFWLPSRAAYFTPKANETHDRILGMIDAGDPIFAYEDGVGILALGVVLEKPSLEPSMVDTGPYWPSTGIVKRIGVEWDTSVTCPTAEVYRKTGLVRRTLLERGENRGFADDFLYELRERSSVWGLKAELERQEADEAKIKNIERSEILSKDREAIRKARIGQGRYRTNLLRIEQRCRVTGITDTTHLIASHIKPWSLCEHDEHWDGNNGLLLAPHVDHLFDKGRISFEDDGTLLISRFQDRSVLSAWGLPDQLNVGTFNVKQRRYLELHRKTIFERTRPWSALREAMAHFAV